MAFDFKKEYKEFYLPKQKPEIVEIPELDWFVASQFHPEFKSRPNNPHPLFKGLIDAAVKKN